MFFARKLKQTIGRVMDNEILDSKKIITTIENLNFRIEERFPGSGLLGVGRKLYEIGKETDSIISWIEKPNWWYRLGTGAFIVFLSIGLFYALFSMEIDLTKPSFESFVTIAESVMNELVLLGAAVVFLVSIEMRSKRKKVVSSINKLRSIAHVIDAHQLTKDPDSILKGVKRTKHSPKRTLTTYELGRYLDYCSELLSLTGKVGFLYVQKFDDSVSVKAVNDLENLTTGLSRKIWQKIMVINQTETD
jgi:hypothetical protein